jgi:outer membrane lipoprotein-sorting protein
MKQWPLCCLLAFLFCAACKSQSEPTAVDNTATETIVSATPPFKTKEPERYHATRTIIIVSGGKTIVTKNLIARDGDLRRQEPDNAASKRIVYLDLPEGKFVLLVDDKVYADVAGDLETNEEEDVTPEHLLHTDGVTTSYRKLGTETIGGRNATKYRVVVNSSSAENVSQSETLIWIDEGLGMPIRSETTSPDGTRITMELSDIVLDADRQLFQVPNDYEKIAFSKLRTMLTTTAAAKK